jgi:hypothetical protein
MLLIISLFVVTSSFVVCSLAAPQGDKSLNGRRLAVRNLLEQLHSPARRSFCRQKDESCRGFPKCCDSMVCYWEHGYSAIQSGVCVECIDEGLTCQRDSQCCSNLICQKGSNYYVDGTCRGKLPLEAECHHNDQCQSDYCKIRWYESIKGYGGRCDVNN